MKHYALGEQQGLRSLCAGERPAPIAGPGEALLRVRLVCLNHRDLLAVSGAYGAPRPAHRIPLSDGVGEVLSVGLGVQGLAAGDRVVCSHFVDWLSGDWSPAYLAQDLGISRDGWLAERIVVPAAALVRLPASLSDEQAVVLPAAGVTAWRALVSLARIKAGDLVLTLGTGGVSLLVLQIARLHGARVAITSSSDDKLARMRELGADITVNYRRQPDWAAALLAANGGAGADIIVETGGAATLAQSVAAAAPNARIALVGALGGAARQDPALWQTLLLKNLQLFGVTSGSRAMLAELVRAVAARPWPALIHRSFDFDQAAAAYACLKAAAHIGKIAIRINPGSPDPQ